MQGSMLDKWEEQIKKLNKEVDGHKGSINKLERDLDTMEQYCPNLAKGSKWQKWNFS